MSPARAPRPAFDHPLRPATIAVAPPQVRVAVRNVGDAQGSITVTVHSLVVLSTQPAAASSALGSQTALILNGRGFDATSCGRHAVTVQGVAAPVVSCSSTQLQVVVAGSGAVVPSAAVVVRLASVGGAGFDDTASLASGLPLSAGAPAITSVSPTVASAGGAELSFQVGRGGCNRSGTADPPDLS